MSKVKSEYDDLDKYKNYEGSIAYYKKDTDLLHNPYGPAVINISRFKSYCIEGLYHRLDGPAIIWPNGEQQYLIDDKYLTKEEFETHPKRLKFLGKEHLTCLI